MVINYQCDDVSEKGVYMAPPPIKKNNFSSTAEDPSFSDLVDVPELYSLMEVNYAATGMPSGIIDVMTGEVYAGAGWQTICTKFHRANPETNARCIESDTSILKRIKNGESGAYKCANGLWDIGTPIFCENRHVATYFLGQFFYEDEPVDRDWFSAQADRFGFDKQAYLEALDAVPRFSRKKVEEILKFNKAMSAFLSKMATQALIMKRELAQRMKAEKDLRSLQGYLANIINSMPSALIGVDTNGVVTQWNDSAERMTGVPADKALGVDLNILLPRLTTDVPHIREAIRIKSKREDLKRPWREDGQTRYEDVTIFPLVTNDVEGAVVRIDDVTDRIHLEQMMVQSEKMMSVGGLAAGMAHEINNPLAAILGYTHNIKKRIFGDLNKNRTVANECGIDMESLHSYMAARGIDQMLDGVSESGERAASIVSNMLSFSRKSDRRLGKHDMVALLDKTLELAASDYDLKKDYDFKKVKVVKEYASNVPPVLCENTEVQQVVLNLLKNGAEAMAGKNYGKTGPQLTLRLRRTSDMAVVEVEDNGPGMEEHIRKRVFEPFFTTKEVGKGTGLGLSVSYFIIADQHGGEMEVASEPGLWTRFTIRLPIVHEE